MGSSTRIRAARWLAVLVALAWAAASHAQVDLAKVLVGRWEGAQEYLVNRTDDPKRTLVIESVDQADGKWVASGRFGSPAGVARVKIDVEANGKDVGLRWTGPSGAQYQLSLLKEKHLVGKVIFTPEMHKSGTGSRDRTLKLEKVN
jgi:hypothetical protein